MTKEQYHSYHGDNFIFHLLKEDDKIHMNLSSKLVYPVVNKVELKDLAQFILNYLENQK